MNWVWHLAGGLLIGVAALLLYAALGRIAGISGIGYDALWSRDSERHWRLLFLGGLIGGGWLAGRAGQRLPDPGLGAGAGALAIGAGLLVGIGTRLGNGCTSGHGVCGLARLSPRSAASVAVFMAVGMAVATLLRPLLVGGGA
jgi:uncharacterized protein